MKKTAITICSLFLIISIGFFYNRTQNVTAQTSRTKGDIQIMARAVNGEARGEPYEGQVAVAAVILYRVKH